MTAMHDEHTLAAPYVLGALETAERRVFEAHLAACDSCRAEVRSLQRVADALALSVPQRTPGLALRARVLGSIPDAADRGAAGPVLHLHDRPAPPIWLPLAAMLVLAVGLGAYAWQLHGRLAALEGRVAAAEQRAQVAESQAADARRESGAAQLAMAVFAAPDVARIELAGLKPAPSASARALWSRDRGMVFTTANLPVLPAGRVYQVWVLTASTPPLSAGLVRPDADGNAATVFSTPADIPPPVAVAVTIEPDGGVPSPTGDMYLMGKPAN
jgi:anti-sigma-K factor RskA